MNPQLSPMISDNLRLVPAVKEGSNTPLFPVELRIRTDDFITKVQARLNELCSLPQDWDGYGGIPTVFDIAHFSATLLTRLCVNSTPIPSIVPLGSGGIQIEWHIGNIDLELLIHRPNEVKVWAKDHSTQEEAAEFVLRTDVTRLVPWINKIAQ